MLFTDAYDLRRDLLCEDGVVLLEYTIKIPTVRPSCPLREALSSIADRTEAYLRDGLAEALRAEYRASEDRLRRFTFRRASYRLFCEVRSPTQLLREVTLLRAGRVLHADRVLWECSERGLFFASQADSL
jgi:hypothetical protein